MSDTIRLETLSDTPHLVKRASMTVPHTEYPASWDGRFIIPTGASADNDGGHGNSIGRAYHTRAAGHDRLETDIFLNLSKVNESQKMSFKNGDFTLTPMAFSGAEGIPSHFEISFNRRQQNMQNNCSANCPAKQITVTQKTAAGPEPLTIRSLEAAFQEKAKGPGEQIEQTKSSDHIEESDKIDDVLKKLSKPSTSLEESFKKLLKGNAQAGDKGPEPLEVNSLEAAFKERHAQEVAKSDPGQAPKANAGDALEPMIVADIWPVGR